MFVQLLIVILLLLYVLGTRNFDYWEKKGVKYCKPLPFFGNSLKKYLQRISPTDEMVEIYKKFPEEKYVGIFESNTQTLLLRDPELIKKVLVTDFRYFNSKGLDNKEPLLNNLFSADGDLWKLLRQKLSYAFTTSKLKSMVPAMISKTEKVVEILQKNGAEINARNLTARYTSDVITTCGFGVVSETLINESSAVYKLGKRVFNVTLRDAIVTAGKSIAPTLFKTTSFFAPEIIQQITLIYKDLVRTRDGKSSGKTDFVDILVSMKEKGKLTGNSVVHRNGGKTRNIVEIKVDDTLLIAQAFILYGAGYETTSSAISYTLHQLAFHPDKQIKCQKEIDETINRFDKLSYEAVKEMKYLTMCYKEALRMYPPLGHYLRKCTSKYTFPNTGLTIDEGVKVIIPTQALQNDAKYFENPDEFIPERFDANNANQNLNDVYMPFGKGPRICIGKRLGILQTMICLAAILHEFTVMPSTNSRRKLTSDPTTALVQNVKGGIQLAFVRREIKKIG